MRHARIIGAQRYWYMLPNYKKKEGFNIKLTLANPSEILAHKHLI
jgi:hypothetical protein